MTWAPSNCFSTCPLASRSVQASMEIPRRFMWLKARALIFPSFIMRVLLLACAGKARVLAFYGFSLYTVQAYSNYTVHVYSNWRKPHARSDPSPGRNPEPDSCVDGNNRPAAAARRDCAE